MSDVYNRGPQPSTTRRQLPTLPMVGSSIDGYDKGGGGLNDAGWVEEAIAIQAALAASKHDDVDQGIDPGMFDFPTGDPNRNRGGGGGGNGLSAKWRQEDRDWEIATREWEKEQWEREADWRAKDWERDALWRDQDFDWREQDWERDALWRDEDRAEAARKRAERIASLDAYDEAMRGIYTPEKVDAIYDPLVQNINTNTESGLSRLGGITDAMTQRGVQSRQAVSDAFAAGDRRLQAMRADFGQQRQNTDATFGGVLSNMGVKGGVKPGGGYMDRMFANSRAGNARAGTIFDASAADRGALVGGLQGDVSSGMTARRDTLLNGIAADRAKAHQQSETTLANSLAQSGLTRGQV